MQVRKTVLASLIVTGMSCLPAGCNDENAQKAAQPVQISTSILVPYPDAASVRLFVNDLPPTKDGSERSSNPNGRLLSGGERQRFESAISQKTVTYRPADDLSFGYEAACFIPHHFFRYYDEKANQLGEIAVCFCCTEARARPEIGHTNTDQWVAYDMAKIEKFISTLNLPTDIHCD